MHASAISCKRIFHKMLVTQKINVGGAPERAEKNAFVFISTAVSRLRNRVFSGNARFRAFREEWFLFVRSTPKTTAGRVICFRVGGRRYENSSAGKTARSATVAFRAS
jgi:hypothetical protein